VRVVADHLHWAKQTGGQQRRGCLVGLHVGKGQLRGSRLFASDQPIQPALTTSIVTWFALGFESGGRVDSIGGANSVEQSRDHRRSYCRQK
jgi:hypothetical protein